MLVLTVSVNISTVRVRARATDHILTVLRVSHQERRSVSVTGSCLWIARANRVHLPTLGLDGQVYVCMCMGRYSV